MVGMREVSLTLPGLGRERYKRARELARGRTCKRGCLQQAIRNGLANAFVQLRIAIIWSCFRYLFLVQHHYQTLNLYMEGVET
jgi:hypothetical protein